MAQAPRILTVILNWRTAEMTLRAVAAARVAMQDLPGEIVVVDNDSRDGSYERLRGELADIEGLRVLQSGRNGGFGAGNNVGIRAGFADGGRPDLVYILNSDAFPEPDAIRALYTYLRDNPEVGFAGSYIRGEDGVDHTTCFRFPSVASEFETAARTGPVSRLLARKIVTIGVPAQSGPVDWLAGASVMMRQDVLDKIGLFDEGFFLYYEETDLCFRAAQAGWRTHFVRESVVTHIGSVSTGMKGWESVPEYWFDSRWRYFHKRGGGFYALAATLSRLGGEGLFALRRLLQPSLSAGRKNFSRHLLKHTISRVGRPLESGALNRPDRIRSVS